MKSTFRIILDAIGFIGLVALLFLLLITAAELIPPLTGD
jgi:hypothetical protein